MVINVLCKSDCISVNSWQRELIELILFVNH